MIENFWLAAIERSDRPRPAGAEPIQIGQVKKLKQASDFAFEVIFVTVRKFSSGQ